MAIYRHDSDMTATLPALDTQNGKNLSGDKELMELFSVVALVDGELREVIDCRVWMGRSRNASVKYATVWVHGRRRTFAGHGKAGGYGYHKTSAAIDAAIGSAGIKLSHDIAGVGESAIRGALAAIARALDYKTFAIVEH